jgi:hypothetical protein
MLTGVNLIPQDFDQVHNALCDLNQVARKLGEVSPHLAADILKSLEQIRKPLRPAYDEDQRLSEARENHYESWGEEFGIKNSAWSMSEVDYMTSPSPYLKSDMPKLLVYKDHWGHQPVMTELEPGIRHWGYLWLMSDLLIRRSGDEHHIFIEGFELGHWDGNNCLFLNTGS